MRAARVLPALAGVVLASACVSDAARPPRDETGPGLYLYEADVSQGLRGHFVSPEGIELWFESMEAEGVVAVRVWSGAELVYESQTGAALRILHYEGIDVGAAVRGDDEVAAARLQEAVMQPRALAFMALTRSLSAAGLPPFGLVSHTTSSLGVFAMLLQAFNGAPVPEVVAVAGHEADDELNASMCPGGVRQADGCLDHEPGVHAIHSDGTLDEVSDDLDVILDEPVAGCPTAPAEPQDKLYSHGGGDCYGACGLGCSLCPLGNCCYTSACITHDSCINSCEHLFDNKLCHVLCFNGLIPAMFSYVEECMN